MTSPAPSSAVAKPPEYVLGTGADELERLALQNRLWSDAAHALWRLAGIRIGQSVLDVGCGPGFASFDLAQIVGRTGRIVGVDESPGFIEHLNQQAHGRGLPQLTGIRGDVQNLPGALAELASAPPAFDLAYARWVLCFVPDPEAVVRGVAAVLMPGGRFCVQDYFNYACMTAAPRLASHDKAVAATVKSWKARGGDPDIVGRLPRLMDQHGLRVDHIAVHQRLARGNETMYHWPDVWWRTFAPKLVQMGLLTQTDQDELFHDLDRLAASRNDFLLLPPVFDVIGIKV